MSLLFHLFFWLSFLSQMATLHSFTPNPNQYASSKCGSFDIPFPFYLSNVSTSCRTIPDDFRLSCINSSSLFLNIAFESYRVLHFFRDAVLVDFPNTSFMCTRRYSDLNSFTFSGSAFLGISTDNVLDLSDCEDSSLCKSDCGKISVMPAACEGQGESYPSCCYPLSDNSSWHPGDSISEFSRFGCRGFSSWLILPGSSTGKRGIKLEWAIPENWTLAACAPNADILNATAIPSGIRCQCHNGFTGDGFTLGAGCLKTCLKDGKEVFGDDCLRRHHIKKAIILAGLITSALAVAATAAIYLMKKRRIQSLDKSFPDQSHCPSAILSPRLFTYHELEEATRGFGDAQKIVHGTRTSLYAGVLMGRSQVTVHKIECASDRDIVRVLFKLEALSAVSHRNLARILGWSIDSCCTSTNTAAPLVLVVYDHPENGTLQEHLRGVREDHKPLNWYRRLSIAVETANVLAFLQHKFSPEPIFHHDLQSGYIFLDKDFSVKLVGFQLCISSDDSYEGGSKSNLREKDVYSLGVVLLEMITGNTTMNLSKIALQKIKSGKLEEIVDPCLYYHEQPQFQREQIEKIGDLASRCLLFGGDGKLGTVDVARELTRVLKENIDGIGQNALEETFSNSSLLQMISMSPDSIFLH